MVGVEIIVGMGLIVLAFALLWSARPSTDGAIRRFAMRRKIEEYYVPMLMCLVVAGAFLIAVALGAVDAPGS